MEYLETESNKQQVRPRIDAGDNFIFLLMRLSCSISNQPTRCKVHSQRWTVDLDVKVAITAVLEQEL